MENEYKLEAYSFVCKMDNWETGLPIDPFYCANCGEIAYYISSEIDYCPICKSQSIYETKKEFLKSRRIKVLKKVLYEM